MAVSYAVQDGVALVTFENPPVNGLNHATRSGIVEAVRRAQDDAQVVAIVLTGGGSVFSGGADITEFNTPAAIAEPNLHTVIAAVESSTKPVVAAVNKLAMGGGLELALGAHYRVATPDAQVALPEVKIGLLPGAGGTQRLPRAIGLGIALKMIVGGEPVAASKLAGGQLFDEIVEGDFIAGAVAFARQAAARGALPRVREREIAAGDAHAVFAQAREQIAQAAKHFPAPGKCIESVEHGQQHGFDAGLVRERECFAELLESPESRALRHAFFGERAASKIPDVPSNTPARPIREVGVIGAGTMGGGITMNFINAGLPVVLVETKQDALDRGLATIRKNYERNVKSGKLTAEQLESRMALIRSSLSFDDLKSADLIIEAVFEELSVKKQVFEKIDAIAKAGAILASNTSTLDVDKIAAFTKRPEDVVGMHFFSPANVMKLLEVVRGEKTAKDVLATVMVLAKKIRKTAVVSGVCDGFIGNRMVEQYVRQALEMLEEGGLPEQIDKAIEQFGFAMGPFRMSDLAGNDIGWAIRKRRSIENPSLVYSKIADRLCEDGRFGQKTGGGWYDYQAGDRTAHPSKRVDDMIVAYSAETGKARRTLADAEIVERLVFALVNEGAKILEEGIASKASDIDMVYLTGYGFPLFRGGPMLYADMVGLGHVKQAMERYAAATGDTFWSKPATLLTELAAQGRRFNG
ncbi:3-hydroxyacyl-CoA dehydrogenase NAD-binding domain-containing protein [Pararobbsia silviterrae]|uniref:3-hydroxyacyl-CoA dehydrogenase n=1 Tax=Pararobbsia silviterrae TaxID=1792498 RepID=A0A494Y4C5_9BURK|nr:3-hydroxyacyl-CoA dehydrogenase NAD-binding domain-containing protein [Pararobbsia silviterrae]RKP54756.1 3-hydroxyacyl-CoA dehydrogenase [Pararobbsia silviterrae]